MQQMGGTVLDRFSARSHTYGHTMNINFIKLSMGLAAAVDTRTVALPVGGNTNGQMRIDPATKAVCMWLDQWTDDVLLPPYPADWYAMTPSVGMLIYVKAEQKYYYWSETNDWLVALDLTAAHVAVEREHSVFVQGIIRPSSTIWYYTAGMEFTIPANMPNSGAHLQVAPTADIQFGIFHDSGQKGTINFASGSVSATLTFPAQLIVQAAAAENQYVAANSIWVTAPADLKGAQGLSLTIRGLVRGID